MDKSGMDNFLLDAVIGMVCLALIVGVGLFLITL